MKLKIIPWQHSCEMPWSIRLKTLICQKSSDQCQQLSTPSWLPFAYRMLKHPGFQHQRCWPRKCWYFSLGIWHNASCKGNTTTWHKVPGFYFFSEHWDSSKTWHRHQEKKLVPKPSHPVWVQSYLYISVSSTSSKVLNWILSCIKQVIELFGQRVYLLSLRFKEESLN